MGISPGATQTLRSYGRLVYVDPQPAPVPGTPGASVQHVNWVPESSLLHLPEDDVVLKLSVVTKGDGSRQIVPRTGIRQFLSDAVGLGLAMLYQRPSFTPEYRHSYGVMTAIFRAWSFSPRRMKSREIDRTERLRLRRSESEEESVRDVLPELELDRSEGGQSDVERLLKMGQKAASRRKIPKPSVTQLILLGMFEAAREDENSRFLTPEISGGILRLVHLGMDSGSPADDESEREQIREAVNQVIFRFFEKHEDDLQRRLEDFDSICQRVSRTLGVSRDKVRFAMMELLWESFTYASQCVQEAMACVRACLEPALNEGESRIFAIWYEPQKWFGQLVPIVLHTRLPALSLVIPELAIGEADEDHLGQELLQGLEWYSQLVENRRKADRQQKRSANLKKEVRDAWKNRPRGKGQLDPDDNRDNPND
jgi:hypothetical protein